MTRRWRRGLAAGVLVVPTALLGSCAMESGDSGELEAVGEKTQPLQVAHYDFTAADGDWRVTATCPSSYPYVLGSAHVGDSGLNRARVSRTGWIMNAAETIGMDSGDEVQAVVACSQAWTRHSEKTDADGDATVQCGEGEVAVGGGGECHSLDGKLRRSRPYPDGDHTRPKGWRASCTEGAVTAYVNCVDKNDTYDFTDCWTERKDDDDGRAIARCDNGDHAIATGAYCGSKQSGEFILGTGFDEDFAAAKCSGDKVHAYAICCGNIAYDGP